MARDVKETPVLTGADAERFEREVKANENRKVSREDYARAMEVYLRVKVK